MKQKELSVYLKFIAALGAACVLALAVLVVPSITRDFALVEPKLAYLATPCLVFAWVTALPVLTVAVLGWLIAGEIGRDNSFSAKNAACLKLACVMAIIDTLLYVAMGVALAALNALHIGIFILIIGIVAVGAACAVVFAALSHLCRRAADMQSENDLTI